MMWRHYYLFFLLAWWPTAAAAAAAAVQQPVQCDLYMADSTIPHAGLGIFSSIDKHPGDIVGDGDVCIPIMDLGFHHPGTFNPFNDYVWAGEIMGMKMEVGSDIEALCPGLDCAINCNLALINVDKANPVYDEFGMHRSTNPGAGGITPFHNGTTYVNRFIPAGGELFKSYGNSWFRTREIFDTLPLTDDFTEAQEILEQFDGLFNNETQVEIRKDLYEIVLRGVKSIWNRPLVNAFPDNFELASIALQDGNDITTTHQPNATRSLEWLQTNGKCVDHIVEQSSTVPNAGRGAFAKRDLPNGTIITGSPLHHIPFQDRFVPMKSDDKSQIVGSQVVVNYCFGHDEMTMLLCPYGSGVNNINHAPHQGKVNVKVQWSHNGLTAQDDLWFYKTPSDFQQNKRSHLALDYVATRDIQQGEELFLDYGSAWLAAWKQHTKNWSPEHSWAEGYLNGRDWNAKFGDMPLRTNEEVIFDPYPTTLQIRCHTDLVYSKNWKGNSRKIWNWPIKEYGYACDILNRTKSENGEYIYRVQLETDPTDRWDYRPAGRVYTLEDVPRKAIQFFDLPYTTDLHLQKAFRHWIGLPEELLQDAWRNVPRKTSSSRSGDSSGTPGSREYRKPSASAPAPKHRGPKQPDGLPGEL